MITGIVAALPEELGALTQFSGYTGQRKIAKGSFAFVADKIVAACSGAGPNNARSTAETLVANGATRLISWGCAAALEDSLKAGDLILADKLIDANGDKIDVNIAWHKHANKKLMQYCVVHTGCLVESEHIVSSSEAKKKLRMKTNAVALDMESIAVAKVAGQYNLPFLCIRTIADPVAMDLPRPVSLSINDQGEFVLGKLVSLLARYPSDLWDLIKLGLYFNAARNTLKSVAEHFNTILDVNE